MEISDTVNEIIRILMCIVIFSVIFKLWWDES